MKPILTIVFLTFIGQLSLAQAPQKMSYQFVVRDQGGPLITNQSIGVRISVRIGSESGTTVFSELHTVSTNSNGAGSLEVGDGTILNGVFEAIDWGLGTYFLESGIDPEGGDELHHQRSHTNAERAICFACIKCTSIPPR